MAEQDDESVQIEETGVGAIETATGTGAGTAGGGTGGVKSGSCGAEWKGRAFN